MKKKISSKDFRVWEGDDVDLEKWPTTADPVYKSNEQYKKLSSQPQFLSASNRHALLLIFQAMHAAGKDGAVSHVMSNQGC